MKIMKKVLVVLALLPLLGACSSVTQSKYAQSAGLFPNRDAQYAQGKSVAPLQIPAGVPAIANDPYYVIPPVSDTNSAIVSILPPGSLAAKNSAK